jgi:hypothetical protein
MSLGEIEKLVRPYTFETNTLVMKKLQRARRHVGLEEYYDEACPLDQIP